jgi:Ca2+/Na+ antiporter
MMPLPLLVILILARLVIAVQLTRVAYRQTLPNLLWLAGFFFLTSVGDIALMFNLFWLFGLCVGLGEIVMVMFIHQTFYRDRKSPYLIFLVIAIVFAIADFKISLADTKLLAFNPCNWVWLMVIGWQSYKLIRADKSVEDWIKARYKLVIAYSFFALVTPLLTVMGIASHFFPFITTILDSLALGFVVLGSLITFVVLEYLAWVMPQGYRRFLNRRYQSIEQTPGFSLEMSEDEIIRSFQASNS